MREVTRSCNTAIDANAPRILVVDDDSLVALLVSYNLEAKGISVERVERGDQVDLRLIEAPTDLVIRRAYGRCLHTTPTKGAVSR